MSIRVHKCLETLACDEKKHRKDDCYCAKLKKHYGTRIFKCEFPSCDLSRTGFHTRRDRVSHVDHHNRPWKCSFPSCPYAIIGFTTICGSNDHLLKVHPEPLLPELASLYQDRPSYRELEVLLFELTKAGDIGKLQQAARYLESHDKPAEPATMLAVKMGSLPMVEILTQFASINIYTSRTNSRWLYDNPACIEPS